MDWDVLARDITSTELMTPGPARPIHDDVNVVYELGDGNLLKVYRRDSWLQYDAEVTVLRLLRSSGAPCAEILAAGAFADTHPYIVMTRLPGTPLRSVWEELPQSARECVGEDLGRAFGILHGLPTDRADGVRTARYAIQPITDSVRDIAGWPGAVRDDLIDALHRIAGDGGAADVVNCEADMAADHVLVDGGGGTWRVSGLLDFADARIGSPEWDVAAIWFWTLDEDLAAMLSFLRAYDRAGSLPDDIGTRCVLAGLEIEGSWWLEEHLGRAAAPTSLDDLQRRIMPFLDYLT